MVQVLTKDTDKNNLRLLFGSCDITMMFICTTPHANTMCTHQPTDVSDRCRRDPSHFVVMRRFILLLLLAPYLCSGYQVYIDSTDLEEYFSGTSHFSYVQGKWQ